MKPLPIRARLTARYSAVFATASLLLCLTAWCMLQHVLDSTLRQDLQERSDDVRAQLRRLPAGFTAQQAQLLFRAAYGDRDQGKWLQIRDERGQWLYRSPRLAAIALAAPGNADAPRQGMVSELPGRRHILRILTTVVPVGGHVYTVQTGMSMTKPDRLLRDFGIDLCLLIPLVLLAAAGAGHAVSRRALSPVAAITAEARRISKDNLGSHLPEPVADDELRELSLTLNGMLARIDAGFRSVREFTANASHELRTPLTRLRTEVEVSLLRPRQPGEYRRTLHHILASVEEMTALVQTLLALATADSGRTSLQLQPVAITALIDGVLQEWAPIAVRSGVTLCAHLPEAGAVSALYALADPLCITQLLRILLDNACKFTPAGGTVSISAWAAPEGTVTVRVEDTGIGIAPGHLAHIFERFYRVQQDSSPYPGSGLGLALGVWLAQQHQSRLEVESTPGSGSAFSIRLAPALAPARIDPHADAFFNATQAGDAHARCLRP